MAPLACVLPCRSKFNYLTVGMGYRWTVESHPSSLCTAHVGAERVGRGTSSEKVTGHKFNG